MKKALVVGINNYPAAPLHACINDAVEVGKLLSTNEDDSPNFSVEVKTNLTQKAELSGLIRALFSGRCETALFYFSGHGFINQLGGYIVTPDAKKYDEGISMDNILMLANQSEIENKIIILDCCYSGAIGKQPTDGGMIIHMNDGVTIITASRSDEPAIEARGHGLFTGLLLDALKGGAASIQGEITPGSVYAYIEQAFGPWRQRPIFKANINSFIPIRKVHPKIKSGILQKLIVYFSSPKSSFQLNPEYEYTHADAKPEKVIVFKHLQQYQSAGLVTAVDEDYMYYAAINSKSCELTALGQHYWRLVKDNRI
jgi:hypothetical protein